MNDIRKKWIMFGIVTVSLILFTGCNQKEGTFLYTEENQNEAVKLEEKLDTDDENEQDVGTEDVKNQESEEAGSEKDEAGSIFIYVCGAVNKPGVYKLSSDARAFEAIEKAGGFSVGAYEEAVNLAKPLEDGEWISIPTKEEWEQSQQINAQAKAEEAEKQDGLININTASKEELCTLLGVGSSRAESIIEYREASGGFSTIEDIKHVTGIKDGLFNKIKDKIKVK